MAKAADIGACMTMAQRDRLQRQIDHFEPRIRRRLLGKLRAINRGVYDLDDVMASARRRVDNAASSGQILACSTEQLSAYIFSVAEHVAVAALRRESRQRRRRLRAAAMGIIRIETDAPTPEAAAADEFLHSLSDADRAVLQLWIRGVSHPQIARSLGIDMTVHRSQWRTLTARVQLIAHCPRSPV